MNTNTEIERCNSNQDASKAAMPVQPGTEAIQKTHLKSREEVEAWFHAQGVSVADWAVTNGFNAALTREVIRGRRCIRGQSHHIAVALGMKAPPNNI